MCVCAMIKQLGERSIICVCVFEGNINIKTKEQVCIWGTSDIICVCAGDDGSAEGHSDPVTLTSPRH